MTCISEHEEFMREQERAEEHAYLRAGLTPPQPCPAHQVLAKMRRREALKQAEQEAAS